MNYLPNESFDEMRPVDVSMRLNSNAKLTESSTDLNQWERVPIDCNSHQEN